MQWYQLRLLIAFNYRNSQGSESICYASIEILFSTPSPIKKIAYNRNTEGKKWAVCVILTAKPSRRRIIFKKLQSWSSYYSHEICYRALSHIAYMGPSAITINSRLLFSNNFRFLFTNKEATTTTTTKIQISFFPLKTRFFYFLFLSHFLTLIMPNSIRFSDIQWILVWDK